MKTFARYVILAPLATALSGPTLAQTAPPAGQSCGGLLCDIGAIGHKVPVGPDGQSLPLPTARTASGETVVVEPPDPHRLACHDFVCGAFGGREPDVVAPPPPAPVVDALPEAPAKPTHRARRKPVVAKAATTQ